jgi:hypothetical protein
MTAASPSSGLPPWDVRGGMRSSTAAASEDFGDIPNALGVL